MMQSDNPKIQTLLKLGQPAGNYRSWPDYVTQYGFTLDDVPTLLTLFSDDGINLLDEHRPEVWAPLHAWRILGQLRSEQAIQPFIASFDTLFDDDCAQDELGIALGLIGAKAIEPLERYLQQADESKDQFSYSMATNSLCEIAKAHPASRAQVIQVCCNYMANPIESMHTLNGLLVCELIELNATEAIDDIRRLFARGCVDISCAGDLEDVEIELGLRDERSTPAPNYGESFEPLQPGENTDEDSDLDLIEFWLMAKGNDESILDASELDGYFAAIGCSPDMIVPSIWMPAMWGGEALAPEWEDKATVEQFTHAVFDLYNTVLGNLQNDDYGPMFLISDANSDDGPFCVDEWCEGFLRGLSLWGELAPEDRRLMEKCLYPIYCFATEESDQQLDEMTDAEIIALQKSIAPNVAKLYGHFRQPAAIAPTTFVHSTPKIGRNEPCPCGSGKKYKKCCGLN